MAYKDWSSLQNYLQPYKAAEAIPMFNTGGSFNMPNYSTNSPQSTFRASEIAGMPAMDSGSLSGSSSWLQGLKDLMPEGFLSTTKDGIKTDGWGGLALGALQSGFGAYGAMKNYGLAKDAFNLQKEVAMTNLNANKQTTNTRYEDRQRARVASGSGYESVSEYMNKNRIA